MPEINISTNDYVILVNEYSYNQRHLTFKFLSENSAGMHGGNAFEYKINIAFNNVLD